MLVALGYGLLVERLGSGLLLIRGLWLGWGIGCLVIVLVEGNRGRMGLIWGNVG